MSDVIGLAEKMMGLPGLVVLEVDDVSGEVIVEGESRRGRAVLPVVSQTGSSAGPGRSAPA